MCCFCGEMRERSRLNLYRMLMIISVLCRHEEMGVAEGMFGEKLFTTTGADLRWALAYTFYLVMQTSAMYSFDFEGCIVEIVA